MTNDVKKLTILSLPPIEEVREMVKGRVVAIYGDDNWEDVRMDPRYTEYWKTVRYYVERCERIIIMNGYISHSLDKSEIGKILWSNGSYDNELRRLLC